MSYGTFIGELKRGIEGEITAYDSKPGRDGCMIYLKTAHHSIFVKAQVINEYRSEALALLRAKIKAGPSDGRLILAVQDEELVFLRDESAASSPVSSAQSCTA